MKRLCPLWKEVDRRTEVRAAAEPEPVVPSKEETKLNIEAVRDGEKSKGRLLIVYNFI